MSAIATGLYCAPEEWDTKKGEAKNARVNGLLQAFRLRIDEAYEQATKEKGIVTAEILKNVIVDANTIPKTLLATGEEERFVHDDHYRRSTEVQQKRSHTDRKDLAHDRRLQAENPPVRTG